MATRYSGSLKINVTYDHHNFYRTSVSQEGKLLWRGTVRPAPAGFGPGVAYDSPRAYDEVASSALAFADNEVGGIGNEAEFDEDLTDYLIRRSPRARGASQHATKKAPAKTPAVQLKREIAEVLARKAHATTRQLANPVKCMVTASIRLSGAPAAMQTREFKHRADAQAWLDQQREIADRRGWHGYRFELTERCEINKGRAKG